MAEAPYADLNLRYDPMLAGWSASVSALAAEAHRLGYSVVAANRTATAPLKPRDVRARRASVAGARALAAKQRSAPRPCRPQFLIAHACRRACLYPPDLPRP